MIPKTFLIWLAILTSLSLQSGKHHISSLSESILPTLSSSYEQPSSPTTPCEESETTSKPYSSRSWGTPSSPSPPYSPPPSPPSESSTPCETPSMSSPSPSQSHSSYPHVTSSSSATSPSTPSPPSTPCPESSTSSSSPSYSKSTLSPPPSSQSTPGCPTLSITEYRTIYITTQVTEIDTISEPPVTVTTTESSQCFSATEILTSYDTVSFTKTLPGSTVTQTSVITVTTFACQAGTTYVTNYNYGKLNFVWKTPSPQLNA